MQNQRVNRRTLLAGGGWGFDASILEPSQPSEKEPRERFEVVIVGDAKIAVERLGLGSSSFQLSNRHVSVPRAD